jgi:hypothetical protein
MQRHVSVIDTTPVNSEEFLKRAKVHAVTYCAAIGWLLAFGMGQLCASIQLAHSHNVSHVICTR